MPQYDAQGSAFSLVVAALDRSGQSYLLYRDSRNLSKQRGPLLKQADGSLLWEQSKGRDGVDKGARTIEQSFRVSRDRYSKVSLILEYWPDCTDETALLMIKKVETD